MRRSDLEHLIRAAGSISGERELVVIGSQAILGQFCKSADRAGASGPCGPVRESLARPKNVVTILNSALTQVLKLLDLRERLFGVGAEALISTPTEFSEFLSNEIQR